MVEDRENGALIVLQLSEVYADLLRDDVELLFVQVAAVPEALDSTDELAVGDTVQVQLRLLRRDVGLDIAQAVSV